MTSSYSDVIPSCAFWNIRFFSTSREEVWAAKLQNLRALVAKHKVIGISETHVDSKLVADMFFFQHVPGIKTFVYDGIAFVVDRPLQTTLGSMRKALLK